MTLALIISLAVFAAAVLRGLTGFGFALAAVPMMSLVIAPGQAVAIAILLQSYIGLRDVVSLRGLANWRSLGLLAAGAIFGTPIGIWLLTLLDPDAMRVLLAGIVLIGLVALIAKVRLPAGKGPALGAGFAAGLFSGLAAMPGPPAIAYFLGRAQNAVTTRASLMVFFFLTSIMALPGLVVTDQIDRATFLFSLIAFPALLIGTWAGGFAFRRLNEGGYRMAAIALLALTAVLTAARGIGGLL